MRDLALILVITYCALRALPHPWIGIMGWTWLSMMNPHKQTWQLDDMPVAMAMAIATFIGVVVTRDKRSLPVTRETVVLFLFMVWMCITLPFSFDAAASTDMWSKVMKIDLMVLVALLVLHTRQHIVLLVCVLAGSLGFYGFKGGLFTIVNGGNYRVWGPDGTFIAGNNELALALVMAIPLMRFLQLIATSTRVKHALSVVMALTAAAAFGSHSRGAMVAIAAMALVLWWRSQRKGMMGIVLLALGAGLIMFMPESWTTRMETIGTYEEDGSATGRINAWWMAWNLARDRFFGGGFEIYNPAMFGQYAPEPTDVHAAHSIYFQVLGQHGFVGLVLFMLMWLFVWMSCSTLRLQGAQRPETQWLSHLGAMCQVSLIGYAVGGAFLSLAYFDLPYNILILAVLGRRWMDSKAWLGEAVAPPAALQARQQSA